MHVFQNLVTYIYLKMYVCVQIGLIGLVEEEWLHTLSEISIEDLDYTDYVTRAQELVPQLKSEVLRIMRLLCTA